jgi:hypothetical protein
MASKESAPGAINPHLKNSGILLNKDQSAPIPVDTLGVPYAKRKGKKHKRLTQG